MGPDPSRVSRTGRGTGQLCPRPACPLERARICANIGPKFSAGAADDPPWTVRPHHREAREPGRAVRAVAWERWQGQRARAPGAFGVSVFSLEHYLDRLGLGDVPAGAAGLAAVQEAHMRAIPFENIDPLLGRVPSLAPADVVAKLVTGGRGGYCFEHNSLFGMALSALGYAPRAVLARVFAPSGQPGARSHHAFSVSADGDNWLCDTGFGGHGALAPIRLSDPAPQAVPNGTYRIRRDPVTGATVLDRKAGEDWIALYIFDDTPVQPVDFEAANYLCARWDGAPFSANLMLAFHGAGGRVALFNRALTRGEPPQVQRSDLASPYALEEVLRDVCGLAIGDDDLARVWARIEGAPGGR